MKRLSAVSALASSEGSETGCDWLQEVGLDRQLFSSSLQANYQTKFCLMFAVLIQSPSEEEKWQQQREDFYLLLWVIWNAFSVAEENSGSEQGLVQLACPLLLGAAAFSVSSGQGNVQQIHSPCCFSVETCWV